MADAIALPDAVLERLLVDVGTRLDDPRPSALGVRVRARIEETEATRARSRWRRLAVAGFAVLVVTATLVVSPGTRDAVAHWLGLHGLHIESRDELPATGLGGDLALGKRTPLVDARAEADFDLLVPTDLGAPDEVYVARVSGVEVATLVYDAGDELPPASASGVGLLLTEFRAGLSDPLLSKVIDSGVQLDEVRVDGERGYWFEGEPHVLSFVDPEGRNIIKEESRLAGNTLVWERGPLTLRLESGLSREEAIRVAASLSAQP